MSTQAEKPPVHRLAEKWFHDKAHLSTAQVEERRVELLTTTLQQIAEYRARDGSYNPFTDKRYLWAMAYLNHADHPSYRIDPNLTYLVKTMYFEPTNFWASPDEIEEPENNDDDCPIGK